MLRVLVAARVCTPNSFRGRIGGYDCIRTKKKGRMARKMAKLARDKPTHVSPFSGLGKISAATRESVERNLELATLSKTNVTNMEVLQARIDRRAARAARKAEKRRKGRKRSDPEAVRAERERKRALQVEPVTAYPDNTEVQELIVRRFLRLQNVDLDTIFKDPSKSVFDFQNIKQPYFLSPPHESQVDDIVKQLKHLEKIATQCCGQSSPKKSLIDELVYTDSYKGAIENNKWWLSLGCPINLQYECYNDWILDIFLKYGMIKDPFKNKKGYEEQIVSDYNQKLIDQAMSAGVVDIRDMVTYDIMDQISALSKQDSSNEDYVWTICGDFFVQVHKKLFDGNPGHCYDSLENPPEKLHPNVESILRSSRTVWDGQKWILPTMSDKAVDCYRKNYIKNGYEWPDTTNACSLPIKEELHYCNFNFRVWRKIIAHDPVRLENYRKYLKNVVDGAIIPRRKMSSLFKRVFMRIAGSFAASIANESMNDAFYLYKNSPKIKRLVINGLRKECKKYPDVFRLYIMRKVRSSNYSKKQKNVKIPKKQIRERDHPVDDFFVKQINSNEPLL